MIRNPSAKRLRPIPVPAVMKVKDGTWAVFGLETAPGLYRVIDPVTRLPGEPCDGGVIARLDRDVILIGKSAGLAAEHLKFGIELVHSGDEALPQASRSSSSPRSSSTCSASRPRSPSSSSSTRCWCRRAIRTLVVVIVIDGADRAVHRQQSELSAHLSSPITPRTASTSNSVPSFTPISSACRYPISNGARPASSSPARAKCETVRQLHDRTRRCRRSSTCCSSSSTSACCSSTRRS